MSNRRQRGRASERIVAAYLQENGFPDAAAVEAFAPGVDVRNVGRWAVEVKSRRGLDLAAWLRQAQRQAEPGSTPLLIVRLNGQGPQSIGDWAAITRLSDFPFES
jgi:hypothetical protein